MTTVQLPPSWNTNLAAEQAELLQRELSRELPQGHVLKGQTCIACAVGADPDDVVFRLSDRRLYASILVVFCCEWQNAGQEKCVCRPWCVATTGKRELTRGIAAVACC
jgi:hypothetical protein